MAGPQMFRPAVTSSARRHARRLGPGLVLVGAGAGVAFLVQYLLVGGRSYGLAVPVMSPLLLGILVGALVANFGLVGAEALPGATFAARRLLRLGVALLGFRLAWGDLGELGLGGLGALAALVAAVIAVGIYLGRRLEAGAGLTLLVATGFAVCGTSAAAAAKELAGADEEDMARAVGLITIWGTVGVVGLPLAAGPLGLDPEQFGVLVGASVHDVGQVVAAASSVGDAATEPALLVKLARVALLAPVVAVLSLSHRNRASADGAGAGRQAPIVPLFVAGFLSAAAVRSSGVVPASWLDVVLTVNQVVLVLAMVGLGTQVRLASLRSCGLRPIALASALWALLLLGAYALATWL